MFKGRVRPLGLLLALGLLALHSFARAQEGEGKAPQQWAMIVAVQDYESPKVPDLFCTLRDASALRQTLRERAGMPDDHILLMTDESPDDRKPRAANVRHGLATFLAKAGPDDRVIVFFSGHGILCQDRTVLLTADFDNKSLATALPVAEVRAALADCRAATKFLLLDCCHAAGDKGLDPEFEENKGAASRALADEIKPRGEDNYLILASCRSDETSMEWRDKQQGFFTFWLCRGLEGGADQNGDGNLTVSEVYNYTHERVMTSVAQVFAHGRTQEPMWMRNSRVGGDPVLLSLLPEGRDSLCRRLAAQLDLEVRTQKMKRVGVRPFSELLPRSQPQTGASAALNFAEAVRATLAELAKVEPRYEVVGGLVKGFTDDVRGDAGAMRHRAEKAGGIDGLVDGSLRARRDALLVSCELFTDDARSVARPSSLMRLSDAGFGDLGSSFYLRDRPAAEPYNVRLTGYVAEQSRKKHPLDPASKSAFPFQVEIWAVSEGTWARKPARFEDNAMLVGARLGEEFLIRIRSEQKQPVGVALLVDGVNAMGMRREELGDAQLMVLDPRFKNYLDVEGWYPLPVPGAAGTSRRVTAQRFKFTDVAKSVAGELGASGESIGVITAAFYAPKGMGLGVGRGQSVDRVQGTVEFTRGQLLGAVNIKYVDENELYAAGGPGR